MKAFKLSLLSAAVVSLALNTACGSKTEDKEDTAAATSDFTYADTKAIVDANCATSGCHAADSVNKHYTTLAEIKAAPVSEMIARIKATGSSRMPQDNTTFETSEDGEILLDWLAGGADLK